MSDFDRNYAARLGFGAAAIDAGLRCASWGTAAKRAATEVKADLDEGSKKGERDRHVDLARAAVLTIADRTADRRAPNSSFCHSLAC